MKTCIVCAMIRLDGVNIENALTLYEDFGATVISVFPMERYVVAVCRVDRKKVVKFRAIKAP